MNDRAWEPDSEILVVGIGNDFRLDDALGLEVVREISKQSVSGVTVIEHHGEGGSLMDLWRNRKHVLVVDALSSGGEPGQVHRIDATTTKVPTEFFHYSSHAFGLAEAIEMSRALNQLPDSLIVYGIIGEAFDIGVGLSDPVRENIPGLVEMIVMDVQEIHRELQHEVLSS